MTAANFDDAKDKMHKVVVHLQDQFGSVRTGRASPALVEKLRVDYYGSEVPLQQLAGFSVPEARVLVIAPYDKGALKSIEKAIQASDLGVNPSNDGAIIRITFPELTTDRRKELVKVVKKMAEDGVSAVVDAVHTGKSPSGFHNTGATLITDQPIPGIASQDSTWGAANCWC